MTSPRPAKLNTAAKIRRQLNKGKSAAEIAKTTGASVGYVYAIKAKMTQPAPAPEPKPADIKIEVPLIPFAPIPQPGIAGLKNEPQPQPIAAHAASEIEIEQIAKEYHQDEEPNNSRYVWVIAGIVLLVALFLWYYGHRG